MVVLALCALPGPARADKVQVGQVTFNAVSSGTPGLDQFEVDNFTGTNNLFGILSPVADNLAFLSATLTLTCANAACTSDLGGSTLVIQLGEIDPGSVVTQFFSSTDEFSQAVFTENFSETNVGLVDGATFLGSESMTTDLLPSSGTTLTAGQPGDTVTLFDSSAPVATPEPCALLMISVGLAGLFVMRRRSQSP
jgi:hypothetical protein